MKNKQTKINYTKLSFIEGFSKQEKQKRDFHLINMLCFFCIIISKVSLAQTLSINTSGALPDSSAMVDIISPNKGLLIPRVSLTSTTDTTTITKPAISLLVYNTNISMASGKLGFWYWNGSHWVQAIGPIGTTGSTGATGLIGITGTTGADGIAGMTGTTGVAGITGATGINGIVGATGSTGAIGIVGVTGTTGANGIAGVTGTTGSNGIAGTTGSTGADGSANAWGIIGTTGTTDGTNFIGTTDNKPFNIKVNNQKSGRIDNTLGNAFWGYLAGNANSTGYYNTANGNQALYTNTTGANNTAYGHQALYYTTTGGYNTATGDVTLYNNTTGSYNTATGAQALNYNTTGSWNTATGMQTLTVNTTGDENTATGYNALNSNSTGYQNTGDGFYAGNTNTTGYNNSFLGYNANPSTNALNNATAIGANTSVNATNKVRIGNSSVTVIEGQVAFTSVSDGRFKTNITEEDVKGLEFIMRLRPVVYNLDTKKFEEFLTKNMSEKIRNKHFEGRDFTASTAIRHSGFVAQEVEQAAQETNYNFSGLHKPDTQDDNYGLAYSEFVVPLVKGMQQQQKLITDQQKQLNTKDSVLTSLQTQINQLTETIRQIQAPK